MDTRTIAEGEYVVIEGGDVSKVLKIEPKAPRKIGALGHITLDSLVGKAYHSYVKYIKAAKGFETVSSEEAHRPPPTEESTEETVRDNRNLEDTSTAQRVDEETIASLKKEAKLDEIVPQLIAGSETFEHKSVFAQQKYVRRKSSHYEQCFYLRPPALRDVCHPSLMFGDIFVHHHTLQYLIDKAGVFYQSSCLLFDESMGIVPAGLLRILGSASSESPGRLVHITSPKHKVKRKFFDMLGVSVDNPAYVPTTLTVTLELVHNTSKDVVSGRFTSLIIVSRGNAAIWFDRLFPFLEIGGSVAVLSSSLSSLERLEGGRRANPSHKIVQVDIVEMGPREYQVIPNCTHPLVKQGPHAGYVYSGVKVG